MQLLVARHSEGKPPFLITTRSLPEAALRQFQGSTRLLTRQRLRLAFSQSFQPPSRPQMQPVAPLPGWSHEAVPQPFSSCNVQTASAQLCYHVLTGLLCDLAIIKTKSMFKGHGKKHQPTLHSWIRLWCTAAYCCYHAKQPARHGLQ